MNINKLKKEFFNKCLSKTKANSKYSNAKIIGYLVNQAVQNQAIESVEGISPDTLQRRLELGDGYDFSWLENFNSLALSLIPTIVKHDRRKRVEILIDDSSEPFFGNFDKMNLFLEENNLPNFLTSHVVQRGSTGSFNYCVITLKTKNIILPVLILPKINKADLTPIIEFVLEEIKRAVPNAILLGDRGFGNQKIIRLCQKLKLNYCIRLKCAGELKIVKKKGRRYFWHKFNDIKFRVIMHNSHGRETFFFAVGKKTGTSQWFRHLYKGRWSIENLFKNADKRQLKTNSRNPLMRLFCFTFSIFLLLIYNLKKLTTKTTILSIRKSLLEIFGIKIQIIFEET